MSLSRKDSFNKIRESINFLENEKGEHDSFSSESNEEKNSPKSENIALDTYSSDDDTNDEFEKSINDSFNFERSQNKISHLQVKSHCSLLERNVNISAPRESLNEDQLNTSIKKNIYEKEPNCSLQFEGEFNNLLKNNDIKKRKSDSRYTRPPLEIYKSEANLNKDVTCLANELNNHKKKDCDYISNNNITNEKIKKLKIFPFIIVIIIFFSALFFVWFYNNYITLNIYDSPKINKFNSSLVILKQNFKGQSNKFWSTLQSAINLIKHPYEPSDPSAIILVSSKNDFRFVKCFLKHFSNLVDKEFGSTFTIEINAKNYNKMSSEEFKYLIDNKLKSGFSSDSRLAIIHHLEDILGETAMIFYRYCDNNNAPFKRVFIILTLFVSENVVETDSFVEKKLEELWLKELGTDIFIPLLSRIGNLNLFFNKEDESILKISQCH